MQGFLPQPGPMAGGGLPQTVLRAQLALYAQNA